MKSVFIVILAYLLGSIPFSFLVSRWFGKVDIRTRGSGNVGATNVLRTTGIKQALAAVALDILKGMLAVWLGMTVGGTVLAGVCGIAAVLGHCWPVFLQFRGGKGVATSAGVLLMLVPKGLLALLAIFVITVLLTRLVSVGSLAAAIANPAIVAVLYGSWPLFVTSAVLSTIVVYKHRSNITRLHQGLEPRLGEKGQ